MIRFLRAYKDCTRKNDCKSTYISPYTMHITTVLHATFLVQTGRFVTSASIQGLIRLLNSLDLTNAVLLQSPIGL